MGSAPSSAVVPQHGGVILSAAPEDFGPIDKSVRAPVIALLGWSAIWLVLGLALELIASWKLHTPDFLGGCEWLTYGRIEPAATNALLYGWGINAALALAFWLLGRLSGAPVRSSPVGLIAILFWNVAVAGGVAGILYGDSTALQYLEFPNYVSPVLLVSFIMLGTSLVGTLGDRGFKNIFVSQWYLVAGLFWFAWLYSAAQLMLIFFPVRGTVQAIINAWYAHGLISLWFGSVALAAIYYFLPKITGRPIRHYYLASLGFWSYGVFNGWLGMQRLLGAPVPLWVQSIGTAASLLSLVPLVAISVNIFGTLRSGATSIAGSGVLRYVTFAAVAYFVSSLQMVLTSFGRGAASTQLTFASQSPDFLSFFGLFTMAAFGAIYFLVPRITRRGWASSRLAGIHFLTTAVGVVLIYLCLLGGGIRQGAELSNPDVGFLQIIKDLQPYLLGRTAGLAVLITGQIAFAVNLFLTFARAGRVQKEPLVLPQPPQMEAVS